MNDELLGSYVDREKFEADTDFIETGLKRVSDLFDKVNGVKITLGGAKSLGGVASAADEGIKANSRLEQSLKAVKSVIDQRFASEAKLATLQADYVKQTAANTLEIQKQNKQLKDKAAYNAAETGSIEKARAAVRLLNTERNKLNIYTEEGQKRQQKLNEQINKYNDFIKKSVDNLSAQKINIGNYQGSAKIIVDALEKEKKKLEELEKTKIRVQNAGGTFTPGTVQNRTTVTGFGGGGASGGITNLGSDAAATTKEVQKLDAEMEKSRTIIEGFSRITEQPKFLNIAGKMGDANQELKFFTKSLIDLERQGLGNSQSAIELRKHLAELTDQIGDAKAEVKALSSDTRGFDLFAGSVSFAADAMQLFAGAAVLAGASEEDAAEATKTLTAIQAVANGVKGVANELTTRGTAANKIYAFAQNQVSIAMDTTATAGARLKAVMATIGFGVAILAIGLLVANFSKIKDALTGATNATKAYNETLKDYEKGASEAVEKTNAVKLAFNQAKEGVISKKEALKIYNDTLGDTFGKAKSLAEAEQLYNDKAGVYIQIMGLKAQANALFAKSAEFSAKAVTAANEDQISLFAKLRAGIQAYTGSAADGVKTLVDSQNEGVKAAVDDAKKNAADLFSEAEKLANKMQTLEKTSKINIDPKKETKKTIDDTKLKDELEAEKKKNAAIRALAIENANEIIRINQSVVDSDTASFKEKLVALDNVNEQRKKIAAIELAGAVEGEEKIEKHKRVVIEKSQDEIALSVTQFNNKLKGFDDQKYKDQETARKDAQAKALKDLADQQEKELALLLEGKEKQQAGLDEDHSGDVIALNDRFAKGKISQEQYNIKREKLDYDFHAKSLQAEIDYTKKFLVVMEGRGVDVSKEKARLADLEMQLSGATKERIIKNEDEKKAAALATIDKITQGYQIIADIVSGALNAAATSQKNKIQEEITAIDERKDADLKANDARIQSDEKRAANATLINQRADAQKQALDRRQKQIDQQKARADKALAIFSITLSTAKNVAAAGTPWGKIFALISGAAQLAIAIATPIPKFWKGKKRGQAYEGPGIVNDGPNMEVIEREDGSIEMPSERNALIHVGRNDTIHPDKDAWVANTINAAFRDGKRLIGMPVNENTSNNHMLAEKMDKQTQLLKEIAGKRELHLSATEGGMNALWRSLSSKVKYTDENTNW